MSKCQSCQSPAIHRNMCESCLEGLLESYADTEVAQDALIVQLKHELNQANHREAQALTDANNCRQVMFYLQQQQEEV